MRVSTKSGELQYGHLSNPQALVPESLMPRYAFLAETPLRTDDIAQRLRTNRVVGVPYTDEAITNARADLETQANPAMDNTDLMRRYPKANVVSGNGRQIMEMDALVAYLQVLGTMVNFADVTAEQKRQ